MITIPTGDFIGILSDALPFAPTHKGSIWRAVRVWWDAQQMHAEAISGSHWGRSTWDQDDEPVEEYQAEFTTGWGGDDPPWSVLVDLDDAKKLVQVYKLTGKGVYYVPLFVEQLGNGLRVQRTRDSGHAAITTVASGVDTPWPDIAKVLKLADGPAVPVTTMRLNADLVAAFSSVRQRDHMRCRFHGETGAVHVRIGERFVGAVMPSREPERIGAAPAAAPVEQIEGQHELDV